MPAPPSLIETIPLSPAWTLCLCTYACVRLEWSNWNASLTISLSFGKPFHGSSLPAGKKKKPSRYLQIPQHHVRSSAIWAQLVFPVASTVSHYLALPTLIIPNVHRLIHTSPRLYFRRSSDQWCSSLHKSTSHRKSSSPALSSSFMCLPPSLSPPN